MIELKRGASMAKCFGVDVEVISPAEAGRRWPLMRTDDLAGAVWIPRDGRTNPIDTTLALAKGARNGGATIVENVTVTGIHRQNGAATGVSTDRGDIACDVVVNCAGMWGREVGRLAGVNVPLHASEHFYIVTEPMPGVTRELPVLRGPRRLHLCPRGSRRAAHGRLRAGGQALGDGRIPQGLRVLAAARGLGAFPRVHGAGDRAHPRAGDGAGRSEERREGKECRSRWSPYH